MDCGDFECDAVRLVSNHKWDWVLLEVSFFVVNGQTEQTLNRTGKRKSSEMALQIRDGKMALTTSKTKIPAPERRCDWKK